MSLPRTRLAVRPGPPLSGSFLPPGDKSITHRAYLLGLVAAGETVIEGPNPGSDCEATLACARVLGATVSRRSGAVLMEGRAGTLRPPDRVLDCGNSGTTLRLLAGILAGQPFDATLDGDGSLRRRPVSRIIEPLRAMGARIGSAEGDRVPPVTLHGGALRAIDHRSVIASAQVASCVLLAGLFAHGRTTVTLPMPARDHTERMLAAFGVPVTVAGPPPGGSTVTLAVVGPAVPNATRIRVPGDFSAAAFLLAAAAAHPGAAVTAVDVSLNPTRTGLLRVLERMGATVERARVREESGEPIGDVTVRGPARLRACTIAPEDVPSLIDEIPAWVVAATAAEGTSELRGAAELRVKESDRLRVLATALDHLGLACREHPDGLALTGGPIPGGVVWAADDHRIAMALALLGTRATGPFTVEEAGGIATSFPGFEATLASLGGVLEGTAAGTPS
ncbi:MAG: 3-phosphoshikimate 1-carboxyvinyltransferase [Candidatus Eiseniibacteriota bacterium]